MMRIYQGVDALIGGTPTVEIKRFYQGGARLLAKLESRNPIGSAKDRVALQMLNTAEKRGELKPGMTIIEPTSGNTGIALSALAAARGYSAVIVLPDNASEERFRLLSAYGAKCIAFDHTKGMQEGIRIANDLANEIGGYVPGQFENPSNPEAHYLTTGPELYEDTDGRIDIFVAGVGTGGTLSGVGKYLKEKNPAVRVIAVEPMNSQPIGGGPIGPHGLAGIGTGMLPKTLDISIVDETFPVTDEDAYAAAREFAKTEGLLVGISGGAALHAARTIACREESNGKTIALLLPDSGERYLSTELYSMEEGE